VSLCIAFASTAADTSPLLLRLFESRYARARTLQVKFMEQHTENGRFVRSEAGVAYFLRPGKMRWDYEVPEKNTFLVDGKYVWFYSPADRTATRMPAKNSEDWRTPLALLISHMKVSQLCAHIEQENGTAARQVGDTVFRCDLKSGAEPSEKGKSGAEEGTSYKGVWFEVSPDGELRRLVVREQGGMELEFSFTRWEWNPALDKSIFEFVPPRGVAIVDGLLPVGSNGRQ